MPAAGASGPAGRISLTGLRIDLVSACAYGHGLATVTMVRRYELEATVAVLMVIPPHKGRHPLAALLPCPEWPVGVVRSEFECSEQGFRIGLSLLTLGL